MALVRTVHAGGILGVDGTTVTFIATTRPDLITDINLWLFDYFKNLGENVSPLPPLDDWDHSQDDDSYWTVKFPTDKWVVWTRHEIVNFK